MDGELNTFEKLQRLLPLVYTTASERFPKCKCDIEMAEIPYSYAPLPVPLNQFFKGVSGDPAAGSHGRDES